VPLRISSITIEALPTAKLVLDKKLTFRNHVELAQRRGTKAVLAHISSPSFGLPHLRPAVVFPYSVVLHVVELARGFARRLRCECSQRSSTRRFLAMEERRKERNGVLCAWPWTPVSMVM
jgi:hypothetical protein